MDRNYQLPSLLPYLRGAGDITLDFSSIISDSCSGVSGRRDGTSTSFCDALAVGYQGRLLDGSGSLIKNVTVLLQRDDYSHLQNYLQITNDDIDRCWQSAFAARAPADSGEQGFVFKSQIDADGRLQPFASLFYCQKKDRFFHPPCSRCGNMLRLCVDDELLEEFGLAGYTTSIERYLYCPDCTPLYGKPWYTKERKKEDSVVVSDLAALLESFAAISVTVNEDLGFTCYSCDQREECFGQTGARAVVAPVAFYPFKMLVSVERNLSGAEFLALAAGASLTEITSWKKADHDNRFFSKEDRRCFLETIVLKLRFLRKIIGNSQPNVFFKALGVSCLRLQDIGVYCNPSSDLPRLWDFSLSCTGIDRFLSNAAEPSSTIPANSLFNFGLLWFTVFLTNRQHSQAAVAEAVQQLLEKSVDGSVQPSASENDFLHSRNNYWDPGEERDSGEHLELWDAILGHGWDFLVRGKRQEQADPVQLTALLDALLFESKKLLFTLPAQLGSDDLESSENKDIARILLRIVETWQQSAASQSIAKVAAVQDVKTNAEEFDPEATVIIADDASPPSQTENWQEAIIQTLSNNSRRQHASPVASGTVLAETLVMQGHSRQQVSAAEAGQAVSAGEEGYDHRVADLEETVRIGAPGSGPEQAPLDGFRRHEQSLPAGSDTVLAETLVIPSGSGRKTSADTVASVRYEEKKHGAVSDDLEETVRIGVAGNTDKPSGSALERRAVSSDVLEETLVVGGANITPPAMHKDESDSSVDEEETTTESVDFLTETVLLQPTKKDG